MEELKQAGAPAPLNGITDTIRSLGRGSAPCGALFQRPFQTGSRFSAKARAPSSWSSLE